MGICYTLCNWHTMNNNNNMQHTWHSKDDKSNFKLSQQYLTNSLIENTNNNNKSTCVFSHVPKTGGTSVEYILAKNFLPAEVLHVNAPDLLQLPEVISMKKQMPKLLCGHHPMHGILYQLLKDQPVFHFTMLRDPIDRVISYYNYVKGKSDHPMHKHAAKQSLQAFFHDNPSPELRNGQSKRFSGHLHSGVIDDAGLIDISIEVMNTCFSLVLTTCLFDQGLLLLKNRLNLTDLFYQNKNISAKYIKKSQLDDGTLNLITEHNQADTALYQWAKKHCLELINSEIDQTTLNQFKADNLTWQSLVNK